MPITVSQEVDADLIDACGPPGDRSYMCETVYDWTGNELVAKGAEWIIDRPIRILLIIGLAWLASKLLQRAVDRMVKGISSAPTEERLHALRERGPGRLLMEE